MKQLSILRALWVALIAIAIVACGSQPLPAKPTPTAAANRSTTAGEQIVAQGRVAPSRSAALSFSMGGIVKQISVARGAQVSAGAVLAQLDTTNSELGVKQAQAALTLAQDRLAQLKAGPSASQLAAAQAALDAAQKNYDKLKTGAASAELAAAQAALDAAQHNYQKVKAGPTADELAQLKAQMDNAQAAVNQAQAAYDRIGGATNPFIAQTQQSRDLQQATNNLIAARAAYDNARAHPTQAELTAAWSQVQQAQAALARLTPDAAALTQAQSQIQQAQAVLAALQPTAGDLKIAQDGVDQAQAALDLAAAQLKSAQLVAPFAGTIMTLDVEAGEYAAPGVAVLRLADTSAWQVETTDLTELNIANVQPGLPVSLTFDALPGLELPGKVSRVESFGETHQGDIVYSVVVTPDRQDPRLRWNMTAKVSITAQQ